MRKALKDSKRIVVKVGTSTLTYENGSVNLMRIEKLSRVISDICNMGKEVVLVSSGAIGVGVGKLRLEKKPETIREKQAVAAVGQCALMHIYNKFFGEYSHVVAQVLLTRDVLENERMKNNVCNTFDTLWEKDEIQNILNFGDNDNLSAIVSTLVNADTLIILSDIDGFYDSDPRTNEDSKMLKEVYEITPEIEECAGGAGSNRGTGGMVTKLSAAKVATSNGIDMILANGENPEILINILNGEDIGTMFVAKKGE